MKVCKVSFTVVCMLCLNQSVLGQESDNALWLDTIHIRISHSVQSTARWFDNFFVDERFGLVNSAEAQARISLAWEPRSRSLNEFETRIRVRAKLPNLKNRVDIIFSDFDEEQENTTVRAAQNDELQRRNRFNLAVRFKNRDDSPWSHRAGIGRKAQPFVRSNYNIGRELNEKSSLRFQASGYFFSSDGLGGNIQLQYDYDLDDNKLFRFDNRFFYRDESNDWLWQHSWNIYKQKTEKLAVIYGFFIEGNSQPEYQINDYLASIRFRKNAVRSWLFFELEPFVRVSREDNFDPSYGLAMRVEGFF